MGCVSGVCPHPTNPLDSPLIDSSTGIMQRTSVRNKQQLGGRFVMIVAVLQQEDISASVSWSPARRTV